MDPGDFGNNGYFDHHFNDSNTVQGLPPNGPAVQVGQRYGTEAASMITANMTAAQCALMISVGDACQLTRYRNRTRADLDIPRTESPIPTQLQPERGSGSSASTSRSSTETTNTGRSSATSVGSDDMALVAQPVVAESVQERVVPVQLAFLCPKCNMGHGHETNVYIHQKNNDDIPTKKPTKSKKRKFDETRDTRMETQAFKHGDETVHVSTDYPYLEFETFKSQWISSGALYKHVLDWHVYDFKRSNSSEFVCCYCLCSCMLYVSPDCLARFETKEDMANHICDEHAGGPRRLLKFDHICAPISDESYLEHLRSMFPSSY